MKRRLFILLFAALGCAQVLSDATVRLNNSDSGMPVNMFENPQGIYGDIYVDVLSSYAGGAWTPVPTAGTTTTEFKVSESGFFDGGVGVVPGVSDGGVVSFQVLAWSLGTSFNNAILTEESVMWTQQVGSWDPNSGLPASGPSLLIPEQIGVPEPGVFSLMFFGVVLLTNRVLSLPDKTSRSGTPDS